MVKPGVAIIVSSRIARLEARPSERDTIVLDALLRRVIDVGEQLRVRMNDSAAVAKRADTGGKGRPLFKAGRLRRQGAWSAEDGRPHMRVHHSKLRVDRAHLVVHRQ